MTQPIPETPTEASVKKTRTRVRQAVDEGATDAGAAATEVLPELSETIAKAVYGTFYYAAYFVTFGALTVARLIPTDSPAAKGLHDGAEAASGDVKAYVDQKQRMAAADIGVPVPADR